jgi:hypothetical protein
MFAARASWFTLFATFANSRRIANSSTIARRRCDGVSVAPANADATNNRATVTSCPAASSTTRSSSSAVTTTFRTRARSRVGSLWVSGGSGDQGVPQTSLRCAVLTQGRRRCPRAAEQRSAVQPPRARRAAESVAGALFPRAGEHAVQHRGSGDVERLVVVPQAAGDLAVIDEPRSRSE